MKAVWKSPLLAEVAEKLDALAANAANEHALLDGVVELLHEKMLRYNWVGFYMIEEKAGEETMLVLGPFRGSIASSATNVVAVNSNGVLTAGQLRDGHCDSH